tara:strand:+ start:546 stop:812 length:267 start_codon:yes stop_codon:yes gene_type:complete
MVHFLTKLKCPITSIRRAMSDLVNAGKLVKTDQFTIGKFGKKRTPMGGSMNQSKLIEWLLENDCPFEFDVVDAYCDSAHLLFTDKEEA